MGILINLLHCLLIGYEIGFWLIKTFPNSLRSVNIIIAVDWNQLLENKI